MKELSACIEDYLETIYLLYLQGKVITLTELAQMRNVSIPTVRVAVSKLKYAGLVNHERYHKLQITEAGITQAKSIYQAHSVLKEFLEKVLDVPSELAEVDACKMEHGLNKITIDKLVAFTAKHQGNSEDTGTITESIANDIVQLSLLEPGDTGQIVRILGEPTFIRRLKEIGFQVNALIEVSKYAPLGDPIGYRLGNAEVSLSRNDANAIFVLPINCRMCRRRRRTWRIHHRN